MRAMETYSFSDEEVREILAREVYIKTKKPIENDIDEESFKKWLYKTSIDVAKLEISIVVVDEN